MAYTRDELKSQLLASYAEQDLQGELVNLVSDILADYLYLHQMEDLSILMEDSFLRSKLLSSKIQHAADNFSSVPRGFNRIIEVRDIGCLKGGTVLKRYETVATYGQYKLIYAQDSVTDDTKPFTFQAYLSVDNATTLTIKGNGKYYIDLEDSDGNLIQNISEDITVRSLDDGGTLDESDDIYHEFKVSSKLTDLYEGDTEANTAATGGNGKKAEICAMTLPGYGVRLWKDTPFQENISYIVQFLKCPDPAKPELDINKAIRSIPGYTMNPNGYTTTFSVVTQQVLREEDVDRIYLDAANQQKFQGTMKSINSIDEIIKLTCPAFAGFNVDIQPQQIMVYYTPTTLDTALIQTYKDTLHAVLTAYNITQTIDLQPAQSKNMNISPNTSAALSPTLYVDVYYSDLIDIAKCEEIINTPLSVVYGTGTFNPYQIISDLMSADELLGKISHVQVYCKQTSDIVYPITTNLGVNEHINYMPQIRYISTRS